MRQGSTRPIAHRERAVHGAVRQRKSTPRKVVSIVRGAARCRRKFLRLFPQGFRDPDYLSLEREYKWESHRRWQARLGADEFARLLRQSDFREAATRAARVEQQSRHSMIFSFEKMALRDSIRSEAGACAFSRGLFEFLHGPASIDVRFERWCETVASLPRRQTRVLTWPLVTVFGFIAQPDRHMFVKPRVTRSAALKYGFDLPYRSRPGWEVYSRVLDFAETVRRDQRDLQPRDMIDIQSFIWVQGSDEYA
jgi:hypothetical protein